MSFGKAFFSSCLGALVAMILFAVIVVLFIVGLASSAGSDDKVLVAENSVLHLKLDAQISELQQEDPFAGLPVVGGNVPKIGLLQLKEAIRHAKNDDKIKGIYLEVSYPMTGFASLEEIRQSLLEFREDGKWVVAYNEVMSEGAYYLASAASEVYLHPEGEIEFNGLTAEIGFFKKLLDKLEIKPQVFRVGQFKSAVEPFLLEKMSEENRLQMQELVNSIYDHVLTKVSESRRIPKDILKSVSDKMQIQNAAAALEFKLVDSLLYMDQLQATLQKRLNVDDFDDIKMVKYSKYRKSFSNYKSSKNEIAVIVAEGAIIPGSNDDSNDVIAADRYVEQIRKARENDNIKAIVLRVNSPGGEFRSSDMIWREIELTKKVKPVIASMSDYAASGGYYLSMGCDTIVAQPHTITGSIGIFGILFDMSGFLGNKIGVTFDEVRTGDFGDTYTVTRPLNQVEKNFIQKNLEEHYNTFTQKAADGRGVNQSDIQSVASGRVWTGAQAKERKLVDVLGGFDDAVKIAATKANVGDDYRIRYYPEQKAFFDQLLTQLQENASTNKIESELGDLKVYYQQMKKVQRYQGAEAILPFELQIH
jgi:protease-4